MADIVIGKGCIFLVEIQPKILIFSVQNFRVNIQIGLLSRLENLVIRQNFWSSRMTAYFERCLLPKANTMDEGCTYFNTFFVAIPNIAMKFQNIGILKISVKM